MQLNIVQPFACLDRLRIVSGGRTQPVKAGEPGWGQIAPFLLKLVLKAFDTRGRIRGEEVCHEDVREGFVCRSRILARVGLSQERALPTDLATLSGGSLFVGVPVRIVCACVELAEIRAALLVAENASTLVQEARRQVLHWDGGPFFCAPLVGRSFEEFDVIAKRLMAAPASVPGRSPN